MSEAGNDGGSTSVDTFAAPQGFMERLSNSFGAILVGFVVVPVACWGLFVNEGRAVKTARALAEGQGAAVSIATDRIDPARNGRLVHLAGEATTAAGVEDPTFGVKVKALRLQRKVEVYQWVERESGSGQDRKFTYTREWSDRHIDSSRFRNPQGHENPDGLQWPAQTFQAADARIGAIPLGEAVASLGGWRAYRPDEAALAVTRSSQVWQVHLLDNGFYIGLHPSEPRVGHTRITFQIAPEGPASVVGRQAAGGIEPYRASNGRSFLLAERGMRSIDEMFGKAQDDNANLTWLIRGLGLLGLFIGFSMLFSPVKLLASYVPLLGALVSGATSLVAAAATALLGPLVIALAWFTYRPLVSLAVIAAGLAAAFGFRLLRQRRQAPPQPQAQPA
jgi:hypothetical protein